MNTIREAVLAAVSATPLTRRRKFTLDTRRWIERGARIVGGCCGTSPAHIAAIRAHLDKDTSRAGCHARVSGGVGAASA